MKTHWCQCFSSTLTYHTTAWFCEALYKHPFRRLYHTQLFDTIINTKLDNSSQSLLCRIYTCFYVFSQQIRNIAVLSYLVRCTVFDKNCVYDSNDLTYSPGWLHWHWVNGNIPTTSEAIINTGNMRERTTRISLLHQLLPPPLKWRSFLMS